MKVEIRQKEGKSVVALKDMDRGQLGISRMKEFDREIVLKVYGSLISLTNPGNTWNDESFPEHVVELLPPGTQVVLTVE